MTARSLSRRAESSAASRSPSVKTPTRRRRSRAGFLRQLPPLVGASFMLMELTWYRMLGPLLGGSSYTFGLILAVALVGIAIGGGIYARTKIAPTLRSFAITCALEALFIAIPYALGDRIAVVTALLRPICRLGFGWSIGVWTAIAAVRDPAGGDHLGHSVPARHRPLRSRCAPRR